MSNPDTPLERVLAAAATAARCLAAVGYPDVALAIDADVDTVRRESRPLGSLNDVQGIRN